MRVATVTASFLVVSACQIMPSPSIQVTEEGCAALENWARQGAAGERVVNWDWSYAPDVIGMRARISTSGDIDDFDRELYDELSRYTHSLNLGEFTRIAAECFGVDATVASDPMHSISAVDATIEFDFAQLDLHFRREHCAFGDVRTNPGRAGCASFRTRPINS